MEKTFATVTFVELFVEIGIFSELQPLDNSNSWRHNLGNVSVLKITSAGNHFVIKLALLVFCLLAFAL